MPGVDHDEAEASQARHFDQGGVVGEDLHSQGDFLVVDHREQAVGFKQTRDSPDSTAAKSGPFDAKIERVPPAGA
jgi:hypothetical protein